MPSGSFTQGTCPRHRRYSLSNRFAPTTSASRLPHPTRAPLSRSPRLSPGLRYYAAVRRLAARDAPLHPSAYRSADPGATREHDEPSWGHVQIFHTVPPANTLVRRVGKNAFAAIMPARPCPAFGRPVHRQDGSLDYGPVLLRKPFRLRLTADALPSGCRLRQCIERRSRLGCNRRFQLRARLGLTLSVHPGQRGITPAFGYSAPYPSASGT